MHNPSNTKIDLAVKALIQVFGEPDGYSVGQVDFGVGKVPDRIWFIWGRARSGYGLNDKIQFGVICGVKGVQRAAEAAEKLGLRKVP